jgi:hypothetical protein
VDGFAVTMSRMIAGWDDCEYHNVLKVLDRKYSVRQVGLINMFFLLMNISPDELMKCSTKKNRTQKIS